MTASDMSARVNAMITSASRVVINYTGTLFTAESLLMLTIYDSRGAGWHWMSSFQLASRV
jgi:hypothetical protein